MRRSRRHHYIAQFYLRNFNESGQSSDIWVYDRTKGQWDKRTTRGVGWFPHLFTMFDDCGERTDAFERFLAEKVENPAAPALKKAATCPEQMTRADRKSIAMFIGITAARTPAILQKARQEYLDELPIAETQDLRALAQLWAQYVDLPSNKNPLEEFAKPSAFGAVLVWASWLRDRLMQWNWHFIHTDRDNPFVTSDWPVYGAKGSSSEIHFVQFPISAEVALIVNSGGELAQNRDASSDVRAINRGTIQRASKFIVSCRRPSPGDGSVAQWCDGNGYR